MNIFFHNLTHFQPATVKHPFLSGFVFIFVSFLGHQVFSWKLKHADMGENVANCKNFAFFVKLYILQSQRNES